MKKTATKILKTLALCALFVLPLQARDVTFVWNPNPESEKVTNYRLWKIGGTSNNILGTAAYGVNTITVDVNGNDEVGLTAYRAEDQSESPMSATVVVPVEPPPVSADWSVVSATSSLPLYPATNLIDKNPATFWVNDYIGGKTLPQSVVLDLGKTRILKGWNYTPRQDKYTSGHLEKWKVSLSLDGQNWPKSFSGEFAVNDKTTKHYFWIEEIQARFMKVEFITELVGATEHVVVAELGIAEIEAPLPLPPPSAPTGLQIVPQ